MIIVVRSFINKIKRSTLFTDSLWALLGSAIGRGLSLIAGILIANFLGKNLYGEYGIIKNTLIYLEIFSTFGLGYTATKYIASYSKNKLSDLYPLCKLTLRITFVASGTMAIIVFLFAEQIAMLLDAPHLYNILRISSIGIIFNAINVAQIGILSGFGCFKEIAKNSTYSGILTFLMTIPLTYYCGILGAVISLLLTFIIQCVFNYISLNLILRKYEQTHLLKKSLCTELIKFSLPIALQESLYSIVNWVISFMLIKLCGYGELGLYSAASQWAAIISFIPGILRNVTLSHLSSTINNQTAHERTVNTMLLFSGISTTIMFIGVLICLDWICSFYGDSFSGLKEVLIVQTFCAIIISVSNVYVQEFISNGNNWKVFICKLIRDIFSLLIVYVLFLYIKTSGALVLSVSVLLMNVLYLITLRFMYGKHLNVTINNEE